MFCIHADWWVWCSRIAEEEEDPEGEESDDDAERVFDDVYQDACKRLKIPQLSTVIKESQKHTANLDYLYLKLKGSTALAAGLPYNYVRLRPKPRCRKIIA